MKHLITSRTVVYIRERDSQNRYHVHETLNYLRGQSYISERVSVKTGIMYMKHLINFEDSLIYQRKGQLKQVSYT